MLRIILILSLYGICINFGLIMAMKEHSISNQELNNILSSEELVKAIKKTILHTASEIIVARELKSNSKDIYAQNGNKRIKAILSIENSFQEFIVGVRLVTYHLNLYRATDMSNKTYSAHSCYSRFGVVQFDSDFPDYLQVFECEQVAKNNYRQASTDCITTIELPEDLAETLTKIQSSAGLLANKKTKKYKKRK